MVGRMVFQLDMSVWQGRDDSAEGPLAVRWHQRVAPLQDHVLPGVVLLGFGCDEGVQRNQGRVGAAQAPFVIRKNLANLAWHQAAPVYEAGDFLPQNLPLEECQKQLGMLVAQLLKAGHRPLVLGGGHETAWGTFQGIRLAFPHLNLGIINLDAHFDIRSADQAHSGTPFSQMADWSQINHQPFHYLCLGIAEHANTEALFAKARRWGVRWKLDKELTACHISAAGQAVQEFLAEVDGVYLSLDLDVLPASVMPAVSSPAGRGITIEVVTHLIEFILSRKPCLAMDVVEFNPIYDTDGSAARVAATLVWQLAQAYARTGHERKGIQ